MSNNYETMAARGMRVHILERLDRLRDASNEDIEAGVLYCPDGLQAEVPWLDEITGSNGVAACAAGVLRMYAEKVSDLEEACKNYRASISRILQREQALSKRALDEKQAHIDVMTAKLNLCAQAMAVNDPGNYSAIFGGEADVTC